jgi:hypothetical protein
MPANQGDVLRSLLPIALGLAALVGCGPDRAEQCTSLVAAVERGDRARIPTDVTSKAATKAYFDQMLVVKKELAELQLSDDELAKLGVAAAKNLEAFIFAQKDLFDAQVPSELARAEMEREISRKAHVANAAALGTACGVTLDLPSQRPTASPAGVASAPPRPLPSTAPAAPAATWTTFRHPTMPFQADYFEAPEVGERKAPSTITHAAIAEDDHRMHSVAYIEVLAPEVDDCKQIVEVHLRGTQDRFRCERKQELATVVDGATILEAVLHCGDGATMLKRVGCGRDPKTRRIVIFDVQATYLRAWDEAEARKFAASARLDRR